MPNSRPADTRTPCTRAEVSLSCGAVQVRYAATDRARVTDEPPASVYEPLLVSEQADARLTHADFDAWVRDELREEAVHSEAVGRTEHTESGGLLPTLLAIP